MTARLKRIYKKALRLEGVELKKLLNDLSVEEQLKIGFNALNDLRSQGDKRDVVEIVEDYYFDFNLGEVYDM